MTKIAVGVRVKDDGSGGWATISNVNGSRFRVDWDSGCIGETWWNSDDWVFDAPNDPRAPKGSMRVVEGGYYKTRDGRKAGPVRPSDNLNNSPYQADLSDGSNWNYDANGKLTNFRGEQPEDLVSPWVDTGPIRTETVTTRRIEPGVYGRLKVTDGNKYAVGVQFTYQKDSPPWPEPAHPYALNASELRDLARVATELAEFLDAQ